MALFESIYYLSLRPMEKSLEIVEPTETLLSEQILDLQQVGKRLLFAVQIILSLLVLPLLIFIGLLQKAGEFCTCQNNPTFTTLGNAIKCQLIYAIPGSVVGALAPIEVTKSCLKFLDQCYRDNRIEINTPSIKSYQQL